MKNITTVELDKYRDATKYQAAENGIFKDLENRRYVVTLRFELEENEDTQYPLEDILDKWLVNCTDYMIEEECNGARFLEVEIEDGNDKEYGSLGTIREIAALVGKRVYNKEDGDSIELVIEPAM